MEYKKVNSPFSKKKLIDELQPLSEEDLNNLTEFYYKEIQNKKLTVQKEEIKSYLKDYHYLILLIRG